MAARRSWMPEVGPLAVCTATLALVFVLPAHVRSGVPQPVKSLLKADEFPKGWKPLLAEKDVKLSDVWKVIPGNGETDDVLVCRGKPHGYLRTVDSFVNYEFRLEWKFPTDPDGNSGILIHTTGEDKIWPSAIQVQMHRPTAGSLFPSGDAKSDNKLMVRDLARPVGEWNTCVVTSQDGRVSVTLNGKKAGEITGCMPSKGTIALQSEGSEVYFRRIMIRKLDD